MLFQGKVVVDGTTDLEPVDQPSVHVNANFPGETSNRIYIVVCLSEWREYLHKKTLDCRITPPTF